MGGTLGVESTSALAVFSFFYRSPRRKNNVIRILFHRAAVILIYFRIGGMATCGRRSASKVCVELADYHRGL